jgi:hypothetical protein
MSLTGDTRVIIYNCNMFKIQATEDTQCTLVFGLISNGLVKWISLACCGLVNFFVNLIPPSPPFGSQEHKS